MVQPVNRDAYRDQLHALLPSGRAWPEEPDTTLDAFIRAIASQMSATDRSATNLLTEILPSATFQLLPDWERVAGLPDDCSVATSDVTTRRASLLAVLVTQATLHANDFIATAARFGVTITVDELDQTRATTYAAAQTPPLDVTNGKWRFIWWINIPGSADDRYWRVNGRVNEKLRTFTRNTELECRLQAIAPAHTVLVVGYT